MEIFNGGQAVFAIIIIITIINRLTMTKCVDRRKTRTKLKEKKPKEQREK